MMQNNKSGEPADPAGSMVPATPITFSPSSSVSDPPGTFKGSIEDAAYAAALDEIERLRADADKWHGISESIAEERDALRADLAEREGRLNRWATVIDGYKAREEELRAEVARLEAVVPIARTLANWVASDSDTFVVLSVREAIRKLKEFDDAK